MIDKEKLDPAAREFAKNSVFTQFGKGYDEVLERVSEDAKNTREILTKNIMAEETGAKIVVDTQDYNPALDPASPEFDIDLFEKSLAEAGGMEAMTEKLKSSFASIEKQMAQPMIDTAPSMLSAIQDIVAENARALRDTADAITTTAQVALQGISAIVNSDTFQAIKDTINDLSEIVKAHREEIEQLERSAQVLRDLAPYIKEELEEMADDPQIKDMSFADFIRKGYDENGNPTGSLFKEVLDRAMKRAQADQKVISDESADVITQVIEAIKPEYHAMPNNALMNGLQQKRLIESPENAQGWDLPVANAKGRRKEITAFVMVTYSNDAEGVTITDAKLTEYERQVSDAVISLWIEAQKRNLQPIFTVDQIFRAMPGGGDKPSPNQKGAITRTLEKFNKLHIYMDATEEMRKRRVISDTQKYVLDENYLQWRRHTITTKTGRKITQGYEILGQPIMLTYSKITKQILTVPAQNIEIRKVDGGGKMRQELVPMTPERQALTGNIVRRIAIMHHDNDLALEKKRKYDARRKNDPTLEPKQLSDFREQSNLIRFDTLYKEAGIQMPELEKSRLNKELDLRKFCFSVMEYQKAIGAIKDHKYPEKGRKKIGIRVVF